MAGNKRDNDGKGQLCALTFDIGNGRQQHWWQWRMKTAFNGGSDGQLGGGGETMVQWTMAAGAAAATTVTVAMTTTMAAAVTETMTMTQWLWQQRQWQAQTTINFCS